MGFQIEAAPPLVAADLDAFEAQSGRLLPAAYRRLLTEIGNGGAVDWLAARDDGVGWTLLFGLDTPQPSRSLRHQHERYSDRVHPDFFPFGSTVCGDLVCLSTRSADEGSVWFWDHEREVPEGRAPTTDNLTFVAPNIDVFLAQDYPTVDPNA